jgi:hypothetical protein
MRVESIAVIVLGVLLADICNAYVFFRCRMKGIAPRKSFVVLALVIGPLIWIIWCYYRPSSGQNTLSLPFLAADASTDISVGVHSTNVGVHSTNVGVHSPDSSSTPFAKFEHYYNQTPVPNFADELLSAVRKVIFQFCEKNKVQKAEALKFFKALEQQAFSHAKDLAESISTSAGLIWTSQLLLSLPDGRTMEFCAIMNRILRDLDDDLLPDACIVVRGINSLCVMRRHSSMLMFPPGGVSYRGGGLPLQHVKNVPGFPPPFYIPGKKYRVPMFLATSFKLYVAQNFSFMAAQQGHSPVIWTIKVDPRGELELLYRCKHVNQVAKSNVDGESEFLYAPYSVFTIESVELPSGGADPTPHCPVRIVILASLDNQTESKLLPLAPWA